MAHESGGQPRTGDAEGGEEASGGESNELQGESTLVGVEGKVAVRALRVVVRRGHARARGVEGTAGDQRGRGTGGGAGEHLLEVN